MNARTFIRRLSTVWFIWAACIGIFVFIQTVFGHFEGRVPDTWKWLTGNLTPTLAALLGAAVAEAQQPQQAAAARGAGAALLRRLTFGGSIFYLALLSLTILVEPIAQGAWQKPTETFYSIAELWLLPVQTLVTGGVGACLVRKSA